MVEHDLHIQWRALWSRPWHIPTCFPIVHKKGKGQPENLMYCTWSFFVSWSSMPVERMGKNKSEQNTATGNWTHLLWGQSHSSSVSWCSPPSNCSLQLIPSRWPKKHIKHLFVSTATQMYTTPPASSNQRSTLTTALLSTNISQSRLYTSEYNQNPHMRDSRCAQAADFSDYSQIR